MTAPENVPATDEIQRWRRDADGIYHDPKGDWVLHDDHLARITVEREAREKALEENAIMRNQIEQLRIVTRRGRMRNVDGCIEAEKRISADGP